MRHVSLTLPLSWVRSSFSSFVFAFLFLQVGCTSAPAPIHSAEGSEFEVGQIIEVKSGQPVEFATLKAQLAEVDVVYIGEEHYTPSHVAAAVQVLDTLVAAGRQPAIAMEMFSWDGQPALDQYTQKHALTHEEFLKDSHWEDSWGSDFETYEPLVHFAKEHKLSLYGLNPPRKLVRMVATQGLQKAMLDPIMDEWKVKKNISLDDQEYKDVIFKPIELCHPGMTQKMYERYYQASIFRDEGMAKVITDYLKRKSQDQGPLVSYTGGGHVQYDVPVPKRVRRDAASIKDLSIYLISLDPTREDEVKEAIKDRIADYIWIRALGPGGPQPKCG